ncbi:YqgE/AlgH family protein [Sphingobacterium sp. N143]|uniref:YqgE/AlgH family protein n=1 Tax=Sphingobacterium sp. N143 TaxID=2746727 RepID=UPI00257752F2|nr:YqgE/AlgH family protein [Sphingobacterium sp. N143]MDM1295732.1 YqgE/AlgH family protein [Sphingobacterium sp. N143]
MFNELDPQKGSLLISEPFMLDPRFLRSVILLCDHNSEGSLGFVLNNKTNVHIGQLLESIPTCKFPVYLGGPVAQESLFFVHNRFDLLLSGEEVAPGIYFGGDEERLLDAIQSNKIQSEEIKFFVGYSGWSSEQLANEIKENSWAVQNKYHHQLVFEDNGELLWKEAIIGLGPKYTHVANFPKSPELN